MRRGEEGRGEEGKRETGEGKRGQGMYHFMTYHHSVKKTTKENRIWAKKTRGQNIGIEGGGGGSGVEDGGQKQLWRYLGTYNN